MPTSSIGEVPPLSRLNGPFQLAEYLALQVKHDPHDVQALVDVPKSDGQSGGKAPEKNVVSCHMHWVLCQLMCSGSTSTSGQSETSLAGLSSCQAPAYRSDAAVDRPVTDLHEGLVS